MNINLLLFKCLLPALLLLCICMGTGCSDLTPEHYNGQECLENDTRCWVMARETQATLVGKGWQFDLCWGIQSGQMSNQRFPVPSVDNGADCTATLPPTSIADSGGRYRLWLKSQSALSNPGSQAIVWIIEKGSMMPHVLLRGREQGNLAANADMRSAMDTSVQSIAFDAPAGSMLQLVLRAAPFETLEAAAWQISELAVLPR
jgi:hypothetical protein